MKRNTLFDLQLFAEGGDPGAGGNGGQAGSTGAGNGSQGNAGGSFTYEQAEEIATARAERAEKAALKSFFQQQGMSDDEVTKAITEYKQKKESEKPNVSALEQERDKYLSQIQQYENEKLLSGLNVKSDDIDYVAYKVGKMVTDKKDFATAAKEFLKDNPRYAGQSNTYRVSTGSQSGTGTTQTPNEQINDAIRNAFRRQ